MTGNGDRELELAETFAEIARILLAEDDTARTLGRIVMLAVETIDGCEHAGVSVLQGGRLISPASSDGTPGVVDRLQAEAGQGPGVDAVRRHRVVMTGRLSREDRWPDFSRRAHAETGVESILSFRLFSSRETLGALNLYSARPDAFTTTDVAVGAVFATHAALAWSANRTAESLRAGIETRQLIGTAIGLLMARQNITEEQAFDILRQASQRLNIKLRVVADQIVHRPAGP